MSVSPTSSHHPAPSGLFGWFTERVMPGSAAWRFPLLATAIERIQKRGSVSSLFE